MAKPKIRFFVSKNNYQGVADLANSIFANMTGNLNFPSPLPTLINFQAAITALEAAITAWGTVGNRGSHAQLMAVRTASNAVYAMIVQLAGYVMSCVNPLASYADQASFITTSGFSVKNTGTPQGVLEVVQNLHQVFAANIPIHSVKLDWKKPLNLKSPGNVKAYQIARNTTGANPVFADIIGSTTKTNYLDKNPAQSGTPSYYFIAACNDAGNGPWTNALTIIVPI